MFLLWTSLYCSRVISRWIHSLSTSIVVNPPWSVLPADTRAHAYCQTCKHTHTHTHTHAHTHTHTQHTQHTQHTHTHTHTSQTPAPQLLMYTRAKTRFAAQSMTIDCATEVWLAVTEVLSNAGAHRMMLPVVPTRLSAASQGSPSTTSIWTLMWATAHDLT